jgi:hypothetical protein
MTTIIIRILLLSVFVAHFAIPEKVTSVTLESAPFTNSSQTAGLCPAAHKG